MLSDYPAAELQFEGFGAGGESPAEAAMRLAQAVALWTSAHPASRVLQLSVLPAVPEQDGSSGRSAFGAMALLAFIDPALDVSTAAEAVAAAVVEIHEAQLVHEEAPSQEPDPTG